MKKTMSLLLLAILLSQMISLAYAWNFERPGDDIDIEDKTENACTNGEASVGLGVASWKYNEGEKSYGSNSDYVSLNASMTANSRMGITYALEWQWGRYFWWIPENELYPRTDFVGAGDDVIVPVDIPQSDEVGYFVVRFYGGPGSAEYYSVYVSSNGFIGFDNPSQPSPSPLDIPSLSRPNALIAGVWSDLYVDSDASIITGLWASFNVWYFVVIWNNVLHKASGQRLTFEIIMENAPQYYPAVGRFSQSRIWISYKSVTNITTDFAFGIEDQEGCKGLGGFIMEKTFNTLMDKPHAFIKILIAISLNA